MITEKDSVVARVGSVAFVFQQRISAGEQILLRSLLGNETWRDGLSQRTFRDLGFLSLCLLSMWPSPSCIDKFEKKKKMYT